MNVKEQQKYRKLITAQLAMIDEEDSLGQDSQAIVTLDQQSVGRLSRMDALQNQAMAKANQQRRNTERFGLLKALTRIDEGEFGYCDECAEEIARKRLELNPAVAKCIGCARA